MLKDFYYEIVTITGMLVNTLRWGKTINMYTKTCRELALVKQSPPSHLRHWH